MGSNITLGGRAFLMTLMAAVLSACTMSETRTPAHLVIKGSPERIEQFLAGQPAGKPGLQASVSALDKQGQTAATLTLPKGSTSDDVVALMTRAIEAKLTVSYTESGAKRTFRLG